MLFGINNLFSHMSFIAEIEFSVAGDDDQVIKGHSEPHGRRPAQYPLRGEAVHPALPWSRLIENRWQEEGRARFNEGSTGDILEIDRHGRMTVQTRDGIVSFRDSPDMLRRVYTLVNSSLPGDAIKQAQPEERPAT